MANIKKININSTDYDIAASASNVAITDTGDNFDSSTVEGALAELASNAGATVTINTWTA